MVVGIGPLLDVNFVVKVTVLQLVSAITLPTLPFWWYVTKTSSSVYILYSTLHVSTFCGGQVLKVGEEWGTPTPADITVPIIAGFSTCKLCS